MYSLSSFSMRSVLPTDSPTVREKPAAGLIVQYAKDYFGDCFKQEWRLFCDANRSLEPAKLTREVKTFFDHGLCLGAIFSHFHRFFCDEKKQLSTLLFPCTHSPAIRREDISFDSFDFSEVEKRSELFEEVKRNLQRLRFIQAAYEISMTPLPCFKKNAYSAEILPQHILKKLGFAILKASPEYPQSDLFSCLSEIASEEKDRFYIISVFKPNLDADAHGIGLYLSAPYHFFDMNYGVASSMKREALSLFLVSYIQQKYADFAKFQLITLKRRL